MTEAVLNIAQNLYSYWSNNTVVLTFSVVVGMAQALSSTNNKPGPLCLFYSFVFSAASTDANTSLSDMSSHMSSSALASVNRFRDTVVGVHTFGGM